MDVTIVAAYMAGLGRLAKEVRCQVDGIGCDIAPCLFGLVNNRLIGVATLCEQRDGPLATFTQFAEAASLMRAGWSADGFALVLEAFVGEGPAEDIEDLAAAFAAGDENVHECVVVIAVGHDDGLVAAYPYRYALGRKVEWLPPLKPVAVPPRATEPYLALFEGALEGGTVPMPPDTEAAVQAIAEVIADVGFVVETFSDFEL